MESAVQEALERVYREEHGRLVAPLIRLLGDFDRAEEALQDAATAALAQWPSEGVPDEPRAWLARAARNKAIDAIRRRERQLEKNAAIATESALATDEPPVDDDLLRLVFTCCHPSLAIESQVALTLRTVCGLSTDEIARAFLVPGATMAQRLVRAKKKIREAGIPYRVLERDELAERLRGVLAAIYLVFNEGYAATGGDVLVRADLCREAIRLGELVCALLPEASEAKGLLALMLLNDARRDARVGPDGDLVLLEEQDRSRWDHGQIARGLALVPAALVGRPPGPYALQAAIAALHARASDAGSTDWPQILGLYGVLLRITGSPVVELNLAVALAMSAHMQDGLRLIDAIEARGDLVDYHLLYAARADLLRRAQRNAEARVQYERALALASNEVERRYLARRIRSLEPGED